jgi:aminoglycoside 6'-N-acetyltransferase I
MHRDFTIRLPEESDREGWVRLRHDLWPELSDEEHEEEIASLLSEDERAEAFVAAARDERLLGFVETSLRTWAEGCSSSPVGYVEGWYVEPAARRRGVGTALMAAAEEWARLRGCLEMASDAAAANQESRLLHHRLGYQEVGVMVHFRKRLDPAGAGAALAHPGEAFEQ